MEKKKIEILITGVMAVVLLFILIGNINSKKGSPKHPAMKKVAAKIQDNMKLKTTAPESQVKKVVLKQERDPFEFGPAQAVFSNEGMVLNGIAWDKKSPSAIINGEVVGIGDKIGESVVTDIQKDKVVLSKEGGTYELNLMQMADERVVTKS